MPSTLAFRMAGISKRFGSVQSGLVQALEDVSLEVRAGTIHALVGENGAGKTTLMRCLFGVLKPDSGVIEVEGEAREFASAAEASAAGLGMVSQHYGIISGLTALQNLMLGAEEHQYIDRLSSEIQAEALAHKLGFVFAWEEDAEKLSPAQAQKLEILKLLWRKSRIMILDEPTAMLSPLDADALFVSLKALVAAGATAVLVTHRLPEVMNYCDHVTVLRGGRCVADMPVATTSAEELAKLIIGGGEILRASVNATPAGPVRLVAQGITVHGNRREVAVHDASFQVKAHEIVGLAGVDGSGQRELIEAIFGLRPLVSGSLDWDGQSLNRVSSANRIKHGFRILPEDRHTQAVIEQWNLELNGALGLQRQEPFSKGIWVDGAGRRKAGAAIAERFGTKFAGLQTPMRTLSGGNQQRFVAGRALYGDSLGVIAAMQPARGLDLAGTAAVYQGIRDACSKGACAIVASFDLDELLDHCDRVLVLYGGILATPPIGHEKDRAVIGRLMVGLP